MIVNLNLNQLLEYRRIAAGLKFLRTDCTIERIDGIDIDSTDANALRMRYLHILDTAPAHLLPTADIANQLSLSLSATGIASLPASCRRLLNIHLSNWLRPALPISREEYHNLPRRRRQLNPYCTPGPLEPEVILEPDRTLTLMPFSPQSTITRAIAVVDPGEGSFSLDESLIPSLIA